MVDNVLTQKYSLENIPSYDGSLPAEYPKLQMIGPFHDPDKQTILLTLQGEEANVDEAAKLLLAHVTPEQDAPEDFVAAPQPGFLRNAFGRLVQWWNS